MLKETLGIYDAIQAEGLQFRIAVKLKFPECPLQRESRRNSFLNKKDLI